MEKSVTDETGRRGRKRLKNPMRSLSRRGTIISLLGTRRGRTRRRGSRSRIVKARRADPDSRVGRRARGRSLRGGISTLGSICDVFRDKSSSILAWALAMVDSNHSSSQEVTQVSYIMGR